MSTDSLEPDFPPVRGDTSRTEEPFTAETSTAGYSIKNNTIVRQMEHLPGLFIYDLLYSSEYFKFAPTVPYHFHVKPQTSVFSFCAQRRGNFFFTLHLYKFPWPQIQNLCWRLFQSGCWNKWVAPAAPISLNRIECCYGNHADKLPESDITGDQISYVLSYVPPG